MLDKRDSILIQESLDRSLVMAGVETPEEQLSESLLLAAIATTLVVAGGY